MLYSEWLVLFERAEVRGMVEAADINKIGIDFEAGCFRVATELNPPEWLTRWDGEPIEDDTDYEAADEAPEWATSPGDPEQGQAVGDEAPEAPASQGEAPSKPKKPKKIKAPGAPSVKISGGNATVKIIT